MEGFFYFSFFSRIPLDLDDNSSIIREQDTYTLKDDTMLKFSPANAKTKNLQSLSALSSYLTKGKKVYSLDLLSGWSCPGAKDCLAKVYITNGVRSLKDGPDTLFRCFSASQEVAYPNVYNLRKHNFDLLKSLNGEFSICNMILMSMPENAGIIRYHVGGEFFNMAYLKAAVLAAEVRPDVLFYAYTKSLHLLENINCENLRAGIIRPNFLITGSRGGKYDHLIPVLGIRTANVINAENEAGKLPIDHDDSHAATAGGNFALLLHGVQPKGSVASKALQLLKGKGSYARV